MLEGKVLYCRREKILTFCYEKMPLYPIYVFQTLQDMTLVEIYDRIEELLEMIKNNPEDQDCLFKCETEISNLERLREDMEQGV